MKAPEIPDHIEWLNVNKMQLADLKGRIVLLDFWTYGCINCMHVLPDLKKLEAKYGASLVVVGVHSAKFATEGHRENLKKTILRMGIEHPVINDRKFEVWNLYAIKAWPTLVLIDPEGNIRETRSGEGVFDHFDPLISALAKQYLAAGGLKRSPLPMQLEEEISHDDRLSYPGKVLVRNGWLYLSDTGNNRIVIARFRGEDPLAEVVHVIGNGQSGFIDGEPGDAQFCSPQGLSVTEDGARLFVADTGNHAIRMIDVESGFVATIAGTGRQARQYPPTGGDLAKTPLSSPWDVELVDETLYVAMAGTHQIWELDFHVERIEPFVGSGLEGLVDGPARHAQLAQPSGLVCHDDVLYFADAEASAIRSVTLGEEPVVTTLVGKGLFDFGDTVGPAADTLLQHALGVAVDEDGTIYIADTYNSRIKKMDPDSGETAIVAGKGRGYIDGRHARFFEPGGVSCHNGYVFVADTNNNAVRVVFPGTGETATVVLTGL